MSGCEVQTLISLKPVIRSVRPVTEKGFKAVH